MFVVGGGQVLWTCTGRNKTFPPSRNLPVKGEIAGVNSTSLGSSAFIVQRQGPDGWNSSMMNSTATHLTWRGMGSIRLYLAGDLPYE